MITMLMLVTNSVAFRDMGGCQVVMKEPVVVAPKFRCFSSHMFSQASQNVREVRVEEQIHERSLVTPKKSVSMLFVELLDMHLDCGLFHCADSCYVSGSS
jgi:hypothetical protein